MQAQILEQKDKTVSAIEIVEPKQAIKEMLVELKTLKNRKDDLLLPLKDELDEIEEKRKQLCDEIIACMQDVKETVFTDDAKAEWKLMPKPRMIYDKKALDAIKDKKIREVLNTCMKETVQGEPKVMIEIY